MANGMGLPPTSYTDVLDFDYRIRDYIVPSTWKLDTKPSPASQETYFHRWFVLASKEISASTPGLRHRTGKADHSAALIHLHRPYFAQALNEQANSQDLTEHRYTASIVSIFRSSWRILYGLEMTWELAPDTIQRTNLPWSQAFSVTVCAIT